MVDHLQNNSAAEMAACPEQSGTYVLPPVNLNQKSSSLWGGVEGL